MIETLPTAWHRRLAHRAPAIVSALLGVLIAAQLLQVARGSLGLDAGPRQPADGSKGGEPAARSTVDARRIAAAHLFGEAPAGFSGEPAGGPVLAADLTLEGTLARADRRRGMAIINADGTARVYRVGESVGGIALDSVYVDHVVLLRGGQRQTLPLPRQSPRLESAAIVNAQPLPSPLHQRDMAALMRIGGSVANEQGRLRGFRVYPGRNRPAFNATGLRGGDLVTAVNGLALTEQPAQAGKEAFSKIADARNVTLTVERAGVMRDINVDAAQEGVDDERGIADP